MLSSHPFHLEKEPDGLYGDVDRFLKDYESGNLAEWYGIRLQHFTLLADSLTRIALAGARIPGCAGTERTEGHP